jgi:tetratricopeptide (TPR) repeat protein
MAFALARLGRLDEADALFSSLREHPYRSAVEEALFQERLGILRSAQGRHDEAQALIRSAAEFFANAPSDWSRALVLADLGEVMLAGGKVADSLETLGQARRLLTKVQRDGSPDLAGIQLNMAHAQLALGRTDKGLNLAEDAVAYWSRFAPRLPPDMHLKVVDWGSGMRVGLLDGIGLGCRYLRFTVGDPRRFDANRGAAIQALVDETVRAMLALCEYPERFSNGP